MAKETLRGSGLMGFLQANQGMVLPVSVLLSVLIIVIPLPPSVMDFLLSFNILLSVLVLVATMTIPRPMDFSSSRPFFWQRRCSDSS